MYSLFSLTSDELCGKPGPNHGKRQQIWSCCVMRASGELCGSTRTLTFDKPSKVPANSNLSTHIREEAKKCTKHADALLQLNEGSKNQVLSADGTYLTVFTFEEAFPHHVNYVMCVAKGEISAVTGKKPMFRKYIRGEHRRPPPLPPPAPPTWLALASGFEPRAAFPHHEIQHRIAECVEELMVEEQVLRRQASRKEFGGLPHRGWQIDMWTDTDTHTSFACITDTVVAESTPESLRKLKSDEVAQLLLRCEVVAFEQFPQSSHTADNIRDWIRDVAARKQVSLNIDLTGITPDGAADGQAALNGMEELNEKVDTCDLHRQQRAILFAIGQAGAQCKNSGAKALIRKEGRVVTLHRQSRAVTSSVRDLQIAANIPPHKILTPTSTKVTRWGGTFLQLAQNHLLQPVLDPAVEKFKRENRGKKDAIVESDDSESNGNPAGTAVPASDLGLTSTEWDEGIEMEAFLERSWQTKELIEKGKKGSGLITGAQSLMLMHSLKSSCEPGKPLSVKLLPSSPSLVDRDRTVEQRSASALGGCVTTARAVMLEELQQRFFAERPSNSRMVQLYMSKQKRSTNWLPETWRLLSESLYLRWLRKAQEHLSASTRQLRSSPNKKQKASSSTALMLFEDEDDAEDDGDGAQEENDEVAIEVERWKAISQETLTAFKNKDTGMLNEFAFMWAKRKDFPLHFFVFKQTASHLPHEANVEQIFSLGGRLSDPNMNPAYLASLVFIGSNQKAYMPSTKDIWQRYLRKFTKNGKLLETEFELEIAAVADTADATDEV